MHMLPHRHFQVSQHVPASAHFRNRGCDNAAGGDSPSGAIGAAKRPSDGQPMTHDAPAGQWSRGVLV